MSGGHEGKSQQVGSRTAGRVVVAVAAVVLSGCGVPSGPSVADRPADLAGGIALAALDAASGRSRVLVAGPDDEALTEVATTSDAVATGVAWDEDGASLLVTEVDGDGGALRRFDADGDATTAWASPHPVRAPRPSPDGAAVALAEVADGGGADVVVVDRDGTARPVVRGGDVAPATPWPCSTLGPTRAQPVGWLDDDRLVVEVAADCHESTFADLRVVACPEEEVTTLVTGIDAGSGRVSTAADVVTAVRAGGEAVRVDAASGRVEPLGPGAAPAEGARRRVAAGRPDVVGERVALRLVVADEGEDVAEGTRVPGPDDVASVSWAPRGDDLVAVSRVPAGMEVWRVDAGAATARRLSAPRALGPVLDLDHTDG